MEIALGIFESLISVSTGLCLHLEFPWALCESDSLFFPRDAESLLVVGPGRGCSPPAHSVGPVGGHLVSLLPRLLTDAHHLLLEPAFDLGTKLSALGR